MHGLLFVAMLASFGAGAGSMGARPALHTNHVRALDATAQAALDRAVSQSPTVAQMIRRLQRSDVIVFVQTAALPTGLDGETRLTGAAGQWRYVRIRIERSLSPPAQIGLLGHELHHALEVASDPSVRDQASMRRLYERIGHGAAGGPFETRAAREAGTTVLREIGAR